MRRRDLGRHFGAVLNKSAAPPAAPPPPSASISSDDAGTGLMGIAEHLSDEDLSGAVFDEIVPAGSGGGNCQSSGPPASNSEDIAGSGLLDLTRESEDTTSGERCLSLNDLLATQQASGAFTIAQNRIWLAIHEAGFDPDRWLGGIEDGLTKRLSAGATSEELKTTILTLLYLKLAQKEDTKLWSRAAAKAERYLAQTLNVKHADVHKWLEELRDAVK
jgi:hypothetical protein